MVLTLQIVGLIFMLVIMFLAIWAFVITNNAYSQLKYQNYLLEKLVQSIHTLCNKSNNNDNIFDPQDDINQNDINCEDNKNLPVEQAESEEYKN